MDLYLRCLTLLAILSSITMQQHLVSWQGHQEAVAGAHCWGGRPIISASLCTIEHLKTAGVFTLTRSLLADHVAERQHTEGRRASPEAGQLQPRHGPLRGEPLHQGDLVGGSSSTCCVDISSHNISSAGATFPPNLKIGKAGNVPCTVRTELLRTTD